MINSLALCIWEWGRFYGFSRAIFSNMHARVYNAYTWLASTIVTVRLHSIVCMVKNSLESNACMA